MLYNVDLVNLLFKKTMGGGRGKHRMPYFIFVVWIALVVSGWVVAAWSRKSYLGLTETASVAYLVRLKDRG